MKTLPSTLIVNRKNCILAETHIAKSDKFIPGWWTYSYKDLDTGLPPKVSNGQNCYFLCSCEETKQAAYDDLLNRVNSMVND